MAIECELTGIADQLAHEKVDLDEPISDAGHTVGQGMAATMREAAAEIARLRAGLEEARAALDWFVSEAQRAPVIVSVNPQTGFFISKETRYGNMIRVAYAPPEESIVHAINRARAGEDPETALREQFKKLDAARAEGRES